MNKTSRFIFTIGLALSMISISIHAMHTPPNNKLLSRCAHLKAQLRQLAVDHLPLRKDILDDLDHEELPIFRKKYLKNNGFGDVFDDNYDRAKAYLIEIFEKKLSRKSVDKIVDDVIQDHCINLTPEEVYEIIKNYCIESLLQSLYELKEERCLSQCNCLKAPLKDKILCTLTTVTKLPLLFNPDQCTKTSPLVCTLFGSGKLLSEYLVLQALATKGYQYLNVNCIDKTYCTYEKYKKLFNVFNQSLEKNNAFVDLHIFSSTTAFKKYIKKTNNHQHLMLAIDPGDKKKIPEKKAARRAILAVISLSNVTFNQKHCIALKFKNPSKIHGKYLDTKIAKKAPTLDRSPTMEIQVKNLTAKLTTYFITKQHASRAAFVNGLQNFIQKKKDKIQKNSQQDCFDQINIDWFKKPPIDFQDFAKPYLGPSTVCLLVHKGVHNIESDNANKNLTLVRFQAHQNQECHN